MPVFTKWLKHAILYIEQYTDIFATHRNFRATNSSLVVNVAIIFHMFKAFGAVIILWYLSTLFAQSFSAADKAISASFQTLEAAALVSQKQLKQP